MIDMDDWDDNYCSTPLPDDTKLVLERLDGSCRLPLAPDHQCVAIRMASVGKAQAHRFGDTRGQTPRLEIVEGTGVSLHAPVAELVWTASIEGSDPAAAHGMIGLENEKTMESWARWTAPSSP
jgi:hypothetical protein